MKRGIWVSLSIFFVCFALALPALSAEQNKKDETKITGTIVEVGADPTGKLAPVALRTEKGEFALVNNAVTKEMAKLVGKTVEITGRVIEPGSKIVMEP